MSRNQNAAIGVGGSSILVIFVLLCLTTFATLSLVSANADMKLTARAAESTKEYYAADSAAEETLAVIGDCLNKAYINCLSKSSPDTDDSEAYFAEAYRLVSESAADVSFDGREISYIVPVNQGQELHVTLLAAYPDKPGGPVLERRQWRVVNTSDWQSFDEGFELWGGDDGFLLF